MPRGHSLDRDRAVVGSVANAEWKMDAQAGRSESSHGRFVNLDVMLEA